VVWVSIRLSILRQSAQAENVAQLRFHERHINAALLLDGRD